MSANLLGRFVHSIRRWLSITMLLLVPVLACFFLGSSVLAFTRGDLGSGLLLDPRAFAPLEPSKAIASPKKARKSEDQDIEVRLTVWENTDNRQTGRN